MCAFTFLQCCQTPVSQSPIPNELSTDSAILDLQYLLEKNNSDSEEASILLMKEWQSSNWYAADSTVVRRLTDTYAENNLICELGASYYLEQGNLKKAIALTEKILASGTVSLSFYRLMSSLASSQKHFDLAIDYINKALLINVKDAALYADKGNVYLQFGDSLSALTYLRKAFEMNDELDGIGYKIAEIYYMQGEYMEAESLLSELLEKDSINKRNQFLLAQIHFDNNKEPLAIEVFKEMLNQRDLEAGNYLLKHFEKNGMLDSIFYYANKIIEIDSLNVSALNQKAKFFDKRGYYPSAIVYYNKTLAIDSLNKEAIAGVSKVEGKIAYLRKLKEQREATPRIEFAVPKKMKVLSNE
ncbi:MAG: tetratricopeptide repeat protein [Reichenbachiella sp.]